MMNPVEWFINERGAFCEMCGCSPSYGNPFERHHAIVKRRKGNAALDEPVNIELVCHICHASGVVDSFEHRQEFAMRQVNRGFDVKAWYESLDLKAPEQWLLNL
jgi:hypothetical protein